jgi:hypothetical protein
LKSYTLAIFSTLILYAISGFFSFCFAVDRGGCLTCHRYPGLVKVEKDKTFKTLHIDEKKHLISAHGKVDCRQCHTPIIKIPHTGDTEVTCTSKTCHLKDREKIKAMKSSLSAFHKEERFAITGLEDSSSCRVCHPMYPHSGNHKVRALLNMHTGYLVCEVCHLQKENVNKVVYDWKEPDHVDFNGEPYGTHKKKEKEEQQENKGVIYRMLRIFSSQNTGVEGTQKPEYTLSRIAAYTGDKKNKKLLINTEDAGKAGEFQEKEKDMKPEEKNKQLEYFHRDISKKEISVACNGCHTTDGILDFRKLGFDEKRSKDLEYLNIKSLVTKYDVFYLPRLFGQ